VGVCRQCFCQGLYDQYGVSRMLDYQFYNPVTRSNEKLCREWVSNKLTVEGLAVVSTVAVVVVNLMLKVGGSWPAV
jgi:hypothetical protein